MRNALALLGLTAFSLAACSSATKGDASTLTFTTPTFTVPTGDSFECFYTDVTTDRELSINSATGVQGTGGHHITVYYTDVPQPVGHHPCVDAEMAQWHQVAGAAGSKGSAGEGRIALPDGYAIKVAPGKQIVTQSHYINTGASAMQVSDAVTLNLLEPAQVKGYANALVLNDDQFKVPPASALTRTVTCTLKQDFQLLLLLGHMHEYGDHFKLERLDGAGNPAETLYDQDWQPSYASHPPVSSYTPDAPLKLAAGTKLRQTCTWKNTGDTELKFPREMCVTFSYYFPDQGDMLFCEVAP